MMGTGSGSTSLAAAGPPPGRLGAVGLPPGGFESWAAVRLPKGRGGTLRIPSACTRARTRTAARASVTRPTSIGGLVAAGALRTAARSLTHLA